MLDSPPRWYVLWFFSFDSGKCAVERNDWLWQVFISYFCFCVGSGSSFHTHSRAIPSLLNSLMISIALRQNYFIINCPELVIQIDHALYVRYYEYIWSTPFGFVKTICVLCIFSSFLVWFVPCVVQCSESSCELIMYTRDIFCSSG